MLSMCLVLMRDGSLFLEGAPRPTMTALCLLPTLLLCELNRLGDSRTGGQHGNCPCQVLAGLLGLPCRKPGCLWGLWLPSREPPKGSSAPDSTSRRVLGDCLSPTDSKLSFAEFFDRAPPTTLSCQDAATEVVTMLGKRSCSILSPLSVGS